MSLHFHSFLSKLYCVIECEVFLNLLVEISEGRSDGTHARLVNKSINRRTHYWINSIIFALNLIGHYSYKIETWALSFCFYICLRPEVD